MFLIFLNQGSSLTMSCLDICSSNLRTMGRKRGLYINPKKLERAGSIQKPCMKEMVSFLNCLALNQNNDEKCVKQKELLDACMNDQVMELF